MMAQTSSENKNTDTIPVDSKAERADKLAKQLRDNLAKRKQQSRARNTKPRKFKKSAD